MSYASKEKIICYALLATILLAGSFLRLDGVFNYGYSHHDDFIHLYHSLDPTVVHAGVNGAKNTAHPPVSFMVQNIAHSFLKGSEQYLRLTSIIPSIASILLIFWLGNIVSGRVAGLYLAFALAFSDPLIYLSFTLRSNSLFLFFMLAALVGFAGYLTKHKRRYLLLYFIASLCAALSHYSAIFVLAATGFTGFLLFIKDFKRLIWWSLLHVPIVASQIYFLTTSVFTDGIVFDKSHGYWKGYIHNSQAYAISDEAPLTHYDYFVSQSSLVLAIIGLIFMALRFKAYKPFNLALWSFIIFTYSAVLAGVYAYTYTRHWVFWIPIMLIPSAVCVQLLYEKFMTLKPLTHSKLSAFGLCFFAVIIVLIHISTLDNSYTETLKHEYKHSVVGDLDAPFDFINKHYSFSKNDIIFLQKHSTTKNQIYFHTFRDQPYKDFLKEMTRGHTVTDDEGRRFKFKFIDNVNISEFASLLDSKNPKSLKYKKATLWLLGRRHKIRDAMNQLDKAGLEPIYTKEFKEDGDKRFNRFILLSYQQKE